MVTLVILDGFGYRKQTKGNAIALAKTPNLDKLDVYPNTLIKASGEAVGLTKGQMGNSEVGHLNIGAGKVVYQDLPRINNAIKDKSLFTNEALNKTMEHAKNNNSALHLLGMLSDGGVHSHINHLKALVDMAAKKGISKVYLHIITDGRDTLVDSGINFVRDIEEHIEGKAQIVDICGRVYAMDREKRYDRLFKAYDLYVNGIAQNKNDSVKAALMSYYKSGITDEFVEPTIIKENCFIKDNDVVIFFNFRTDRAREITDAITQKDFEGFKTKQISNMVFCCMTEYSETFKDVLVAFKPQKITENLSAIISKNGLKQFHVSETTKYAHVTFFFNGGIEKPYKGEVRKLIDTIDVKSFDEYPSMRADEITSEAIKAISSKKYDFVLINLSNPDMLGHTGNLEATIKAIRKVDECAYKIAETTLTAGGDCIITADHGNAEEMIDKEGNVLTSHTCNPVRLWLVSEKKRSVELIKNGKLANIAPTVLKLLGLKIPESMENPLF